MNAPSFSYAAPRVTPHAGHAFGGIWRLTVRRFASLNYWLSVAAMLVLLVLFSIPAFRNWHGPNGGFLVWAGGFYLCFVVPLLAFVSAGGIVRDDLDAGTVDYVFTRPIHRGSYLLFRYLAHVACAQLTFLLGLATIVGLGVCRDVPAFWNAVPLLLLGQVLVITTFSAFGFFCAMVTSRYVILGLAYGGIVEVGLGTTPTQLNRISMTRQVMNILQPALGDIRLGMGGPLAPQPLSPAAASTVLLIATAVMLLVTVTLFSFRELAGPSSREG